MFLIKIFPSFLELLKDSPKEIHIIDLWSFIHADQKLTNPVQKHGYLIKSHNNSKERKTNSIGEAEESNKEESTCLLTAHDSSLFQYLNWYEIPGFKTFPFQNKLYLSIQ